jgi:hypothetical protein
MKSRADSCHACSCAVFVTSRIRSRNDASTTFSLHHLEIANNQSINREPLRLIHHVFVRWGFVLRSGKKKCNQSPYSCSSRSSDIDLTEAGKILRNINLTEVAKSLRDINVTEAAKSVLALLRGAWSGNTESHSESSVQTSEAQEPGSPPAYGPAENNSNPNDESPKGRTQPPRLHPTPTTNLPRERTLVPASTAKTEPKP